MIPSCQERWRFPRFRAAALFVAVGVFGPVCGVGQGPQDLQGNLTLKPSSPNVSWPGSGGDGRLAPKLTARITVQVIEEEEMKGVKYRLKPGSATGSSNSQCSLGRTGEWRQWHMVDHQYRGRRSLHGAADQLHLAARPRHGRWQRNTPGRHHRYRLCLRGFAGFQGCLDFRSSTCGLRKRA